MTTTTTNPDPAYALQSEYAEETDLWRQFINGGWITCKSPAAATALRYRMYTARKLMRLAFGTTRYDELMIRIPRGDHRLRIERRESGVVELLPDEPQNE